MNRPGPAWVCSGDDSPLGLGLTALKRAGHRPVLSGSPGPTAAGEASWLGAYFYSAGAAYARCVFQPTPCGGAADSPRAWVRQAERDFQQQGCWHPGPPT